MNGEQIESGSCRLIAELLQQAVAHRLIAILTTGRWTYHGIPYRSDAVQRVYVRLRACFVLRLTGNWPANVAHTNLHAVRVVFSSVIITVCHLANVTMTGAVPHATDAV